MGTKILVVYSTVVTTLLAILALAAFAAPKVQRLDEIDVHRINVREVDSTLRMVISNQARLPGVIKRGKEHAKPGCGTQPHCCSRHVRGAGGGLRFVDDLLERGELENYLLAHSARAELRRRLGRIPEARTSYEKALSLVTQEPERRFSAGRLQELK